ncbi:hypothetical protein [Photobacterium kagoshimensis]|uniref:hypothetical protein n=1 Tax=Photobacterium kagoshimensis TaxID=2910242 RepID=UPI003D108476
MNNRTIHQKIHAPTSEQYPLALAIIKEIESLECQGYVTVHTTDDYSQVVICPGGVKQRITLKWNNSSYITECDSRSEMSGIVIGSTSSARMFAFAYDLSLSFCTKKSK